MFEYPLQLSTGQKKTILLSVCDSQQITSLINSVNLTLAKGDCIFSCLLSQNEGDKAAARQIPQKCSNYALANDKKKKFLINDLCGGAVTVS